MPIRDVRRLGRRSVAIAAALAFSAAAVAVPAFADKPAPSQLNWAVGAGGFFAMTGPGSFGPVFEAEIYPHGRFGRWGVRAEYRGFEGFDASLLTVGATYEAAATRTHAMVAFHIDAGAFIPDDLPAIGAGIQGELWLLGPMSIALDGTAHLFIDGADSRLVLAQALMIRLSL